jgi:AcrR family transcriptional regulator
MAKAKDTRTRILDEAEALLRRFGPDKFGVVDVARSLGMSHGNIYRHFTTKSDLLGAVAHRWLVNSVSGPLAALVTAGGPAEPRLRQWLMDLARAKWKKVRTDRELFQTYHSIFENTGTEVVHEHLVELHRQVTELLVQAMENGEFREQDPIFAARGILNATIRFHHPYFVLQEPDQEAALGQLEELIEILVRGLRSG